MADLTGVSGGKELGVSAEGDSLIGGQDSSGSTEMRGTSGFAMGDEVTWVELSEMGKGIYNIIYTAD